MPFGPIYTSSLLQTAMSSVIDNNHKNKRWTVIRIIFVVTKLIVKIYEVKDFYMKNIKQNE